MENKNKNIPSLDDKLLRLPVTPVDGELPEDEDKSTKKKRKRLLLLLLLLLLVAGGTLGGLLWLKANGNQGPSDAAAGDAGIVMQDSDETSDDLGMIMCEVLEDGALNCTMESGGEQIVLNGYIICIKEADGKIKCSNGRGETIHADCLAKADGRFDCTDSSGNKLENILSCTPLGEDKLTCVTADGDLLEITINKEIVREVEVVKEVEKEVVKEVQKEVVVVVDKTPPKVLKTNRSTSAPTNGDVTVVLEFDKPVNAPAGWVHDGANNKIKKVFTENVDTSVKVCDTKGNCDDISVVVSNIDKVKPGCDNTQAALSIHSGLYEYTISCNEAVKIAGWSQYSSSTWIRTSEANLFGTEVTVVDLAGNASVVKIK